MQNAFELIVHINKPVEFVRSFFNNQKASDVFLKVVQTLQTMEPKLIVRADNSIIGMSMPNERYWFYIVRDETHGFTVKFKSGEKLQFPSAGEEKYMQLCRESVTYYKEHVEEFSIGLPCNKSTEKKSAVKEKVKVPQKAPVRACTNCRLRINDECTSLRNVVCEDYRAWIRPTEEERANWPTGGDATATLENFRKRRNWNTST